MNNKTPTTIIELNKNFIAVTDNVAIKCLCAEILQFREVKKELIEEYSLTELTDGKED